MSNILKEMSLQRSQEKRQDDRIRAIGSLIRLIGPGRVLTEVTEGLAYVEGNELAELCIRLGWHILLHARGMENDALQLTQELWSYCYRGTKKEFFADYDTSKRLVESCDSVIPNIVFSLGFGMLADLLQTRYIGNIARSN